MNEDAKKIMEESVHKLWKLTDSIYEEFMKSVDDSAIENQLRTPQIGLILSGIVLRSIGFMFGSLPKDLSIHEWEVFREESITAIKRALARYEGK